MYITTFNHDKIDRPCRSESVLLLCFRLRCFVLSISSFHSTSKRFVPNVCSTCCRPRLPIAVANSGLSIHFHNASPKASGVGSRRNPVLVFSLALLSRPPSMTVSIGPPELTAKTGVPANIASNGTMPKCSLSGVYTTHNDVWNNVARSTSEISNRNSTCPGGGGVDDLASVVPAAVFLLPLNSGMPNFFAKVSNSPRYSTFSTFWVSYPPATTNGGKWPLIRPPLLFFRYAYASNNNPIFFFRSKRFNDTIGDNRSFDLLLG
mmetsp:Transcript_49421/g.119888  ORF Transcript_49421/g.119888 Transcript_49421/m.119888 type:complete len:263 (-) Transcript_49421:888-1676(-)